MGSGVGAVVGAAVLGDVDGLELGGFEGFKVDGNLVGDEVNGWLV